MNLSRRPTRTPGPFIRVPAWLFRDTPRLPFKHFKILKGSEVKVLLYFCFRIDNKTNQTPAFDISQIARTIGLSRDTVRSALQTLQNLGVVELVETKSGGSAAHVIFSPFSVTSTPNDSKTNTGRLFARLATSVERVTKNSSGSGEKVVTLVPKNSSPHSTMAGFDAPPEWVLDQHAISINEDAGAFCSDSLGQA